MFNSTVNINASGERKSSEVIKCILQCGKPCNKNNNIDNMQITTWANVKKKAFLWQGFDKFGKVYDETNWAAGPKGLYIHNTCRIELGSKEKLEKARKRWEKDEEENRRIDLEEAVNDSINDELVICEPHSKRRRRSSTGVLHDKHLCVWCMKGKDDRHVDRSKSKFYIISTYTAWYTFKRHTINLEDEVMKERITSLIHATDDPFAVEIRYHESCWKTYASRKSTGDNIHVADVQLKEAHNVFFTRVQIIIFEEHEIRTLQGLLADYKIIVGNYGYQVESTKTSYIKEILQREFGERIGFQDRPQVNLSDFVFDISATGSYIEAAMRSYGLSDEQLMKNVACRLRKLVEKISIVQWPSYVAELEEEEELSQHILYLLTWLKDPSKCKIDLNPTTHALTSLITKYITGKRTTFSINLSTTVHGLTKNKELVDILHKNGIGISYADVLMLQDFWALNDLQLSPFCPFEIANKIPAIIVVDNDDFKVDSLTGNSSHAHRTNVMYVQPEYIESKNKDPKGRNKDARVISNKLKSISNNMEKVPPYETVRSSEPSMRSKPDIDKPNADTQRNRTVLHTLIRSNMDGSRPSPTHQKVAMFNGFQSCISQPQVKSKPYYHMTYPVPPTKSVCYDVMTKLVQAMKDKEMPFAFIVGDFPTYLHFLKLKGENASDFMDIYPHLGPFHMHKSYLNAINKRFAGSGLSDILVAADAIVSGSIDQALRGEHYKRALRGHFLLREALSLLIIQQSDIQLSEIERENISILQNVTVHDKEKLKRSHEELLIMLSERIETSCKEIANSGSDMAEFWLSYCEMVDILMMNVYSLHTQNWAEFLSSMYLMIPGLIIYDNDKYGKILPDHWAMLSTLPKEVDEFMSSHFSQSMTGKPYSAQPLDLWIECTMNKGSKMKAGWLSILTNSKQLLTNTRSPNNINRIRSAMHVQSNKIAYFRKHKECTPSRLQTDEGVVQDILSCLNEFGSNPFDLSSPTLRTLESGIEASDGILLDFKTALKDGEANLDTLLHERVYSKTQSLFSHMARKKRKNFAKQLLESSSSAEKSNNLQLREMESKALASVINLVGNNGIHLEELFKFRITQECLSIFNVNGVFRKVQKSKLVQCLNLDSVNWPNSYIALIDMGMVLRQAIPSSDDRAKLDGSPYTWGDYANRCVNLVLERHRFAKKIVCVNDPYTHPFSIKDEERELRCKHLGQIPNVFMKKDDAFPIAKVLQTVMAGNDNKTRIQTLVRAQFANVVKHVEVVWSVGPICEHLNNGEEVIEFQCHQAEADTIFFTIYNALRVNKENCTVVIDSEDTDVYVQAAYVSNTCNGDLYIRRKSSHVNCRELCCEDISQVIIPFHTMTGCDSNSGFFGHGKKKLFGKCMMNAEARDLLKECGSSLPISQNTMDGLKVFIRKYVYNDSRSDTMSQSRSLKWRTQINKSVSRLPPDNDSVELHCMRANYLSYTQKNYYRTFHPSAIGNGWLVVEGKCRTLRFRNPVMPTTLNPCDTPVDNDGSISGKETDDDSDLSDCE